MTTPNTPDAQQNAHLYAQQAAYAAAQQAPQAHYPPQPAPSQPTTLGATNTFALLAIVFAFVSPLAGIIFGHLGLGQIKRNGDAGRGIALTGLIISYAAFVMIALFVMAYAFMIFAVIGTMGAAFNDYSFS